MGNRTARKEAGLILALCLLATGARAGCSQEAADLRWDGGQAHFSVEVADTDAERRQGLMHRAEMAASHGMLFVYPGPRTVAFWMENTLIPLDMLFLGPDGRVKAIHPEARPLDRTLVPGGDGVQFVLEINGGLAEKLGIGIGAELRHPAIAPQAAAWPCAGG